MRIDMLFKELMRQMPCPVSLSGIEHFLQLLCLANAENIASPLMFLVNRPKSLDKSIFIVRNFVDIFFKLNFKISSKILSKSSRRKRSPIQAKGYLSC